MFLFDLFRRTNDAIDWILCQFVWVIFALLITLLSVQVVGRYVFGFSPVWVVESSQYSFVWLSFLGTCVAYRRRAHISLAYLWERAPITLRGVVKSVIHLTVLFIGWCIAYGGIVLMQTFSGDRSPGMEIPMAWVYSSLVVCGSLICLFDIEMGLTDLGLIRNGTSPTGDTNFERSSRDE